MWTSVDYELDWPRELLRDELLVLRDHPYRAWSGDEVELLLTEAFHTEVPAADFAQLNRLGEWADDPGPTRTWVADLLEHLHELREYTPPRPYWAARRAAPAEAPVHDPAAAPHRFAGLIGLLRARGHLARDFGEPCVDDNPYEHYAGDLNGELCRRLGNLGHPKLWPPQPETWDPDTFYSLIEVFHDLVARPRRRWEHNHEDCGPHFVDFDTDAARRVYRALVNRLLAENAVELRLADTGEDVGRLVHLVDEARADLIERALATPAPDVAGRVEHAIALFRRRDASTEDKRSAVVALAGILEARRTVIKETPLLTSDDENALFHPSDTDISSSFTGQSSLIVGLHDDPRGFVPAWATESEHGVEPALAAARHLVRGPAWCSPDSHEQARSRDWPQAPPHRTTPDNVRNADARKPSRPQPDVTRTCENRPQTGQLPGSRRWRCLAMASWRCSLP